MQFFYEANTSKRKEYLKSKYNNNKRLNVVSAEDYSIPVNQNIRYGVKQKFARAIDRFGLPMSDEFEMGDNIYSSNDSNITQRVDFWNNHIKDYIINKVVDKIDPCKGKYSDWILSRFLDEQNMGEYGYWILIKEDGESVLRPLLQKYDRHKDRIRKAIGNRNISLNWENINSFKSISSFYIFTDNLPEVFVEDMEEDIKKQARKEVDKIQESENWLVLIPKTELAARVYGMGTRWCTASKEHSRFDYYNEMGPLYILINKKTNEKFQFHWESGQFMDATNQGIDYRKFYTDNTELQPLLAEIAYNKKNK